MARSKYRYTVLWCEEHGGESYSWAHIEFDSWDQAYEYYLSLLAIGVPGENIYLNDNDYDVSLHLGEWED